ncbi:Golgi to ER traffic protein 4 homolog isoform X1 [Rhodnius prolixus]
MAASMSLNKVHGVSRLIYKIENSIKNGNYYEAHQMYKTLYFRYLSQKKYVELLDLLFEGASLLLNHDQQASGVDLANLYIEVLVKSNALPNEEYIRKLSKLFSLISPGVPERDSFLSSAVRWSMNEEHKGGDPLLHQAVAQIYWKEKNYVMARRHFLRSYDGSGFGTMLVELQRSSGYIAEVDLFIAQVVLQCLCLENKKTAVITFQCYTTQHPCINMGPPYLLPLLNFIWFLLKAVDSGRLAAFTVLCEQYQLSIERDPSYTHYLDKIGQIFFGVPPPQVRPSGFLGNLFHSLMNGLEDCGSSDDEQGRSRDQSPHGSASTTVVDNDLD